MRTMNKIVALSLVLAMALSMMAGAAFKDQSDINANLVDDINLLVALNVFSAEGTGEGYFDPNGTITRSMAAKMMYVLKNKGVDNKATTWVDMNIFKDVEAGAWYEGYVNFCASTGIMVGDGEYFNPNGKITGTEFAKMLLVLIGYKPDIEGYTGAKWAENTIADAEAAGFFVDYELPVKGVATRQFAAKLIVNAINATKVKYSDNVATEQYVVYANGQNQTVSHPVTFANQDLGLVKTTGVLVATPNYGLVANGGTPYMNENGKNNLSAIDVNDAAYDMLADATFKFDANPEYLGQEVTVLSKGALDNNGSENVTIYGVSLTGKSGVYNSIAADMKLDATNSKITIDGKKFAYNTPVTVYTACVAANSNVNIQSLYVEKAITEYTVIDINGDATKLIALTSGVKYATVEDIKVSNNMIKFNDDSVTAGATFTDLAGGTTDAAKEAFAKYTLVGDIAKGDVVAIEKDYTSGKDMTKVTEIDAIYAPITKVTTDKAVINGIELNRAVGFKTAFPTTTNSESKNYYAVGNYLIHNAAVTETAKVPTDVALVLAVNNGSNDVFEGSKAKVQVLLADGTTAIYEYAAKADVPTNWLYIHDGYTVETANTMAVKGTDTANKQIVPETVIYEYKLIDGKIVLKEIATQDSVKSYVDTVAAESFEFNKDTDVVTATAGLAGHGPVTYRTTEDYFFFVKAKASSTASSKWTVVKASEMPISVAAAQTVNTADVPYIVTVESGKLPTFHYAAINLGNTVLEGTSTDVVYGYVKDAYQTLNSENKEEVYVVMVMAPGAEPVEYLFNDTLATALTYKDEFAKVTTSTSGKSSLTEIQADALVLNNAALGQISAFEGNQVKIGNNFYTIADDAKIWNVKSGKLVDGSDLKIGTQSNVYYTLKGASGTNATIITNIIVDMNGTIVLNNEGLVKPQ